MSLKIDSYRKAFSAIFVSGGHFLAGGILASIFKKIQKNTNSQRVVLEYFVFLL